MEAELQKIYDSGSRTDGDVYSGQLRWPLTGYGKRLDNFTIWI